MTDETALALPYHQAYCDRTGRGVPLSLDRTLAWSVFRHHGLTVSDLEAVIAYVKRKVKEGRKWPSALGFRRLVEDIEGFEELLSECRAWRRVPQVDKAKVEVLKATGRPAQLQPRARSAEEILRDDQAFAQFREFAKSLIP